MKSKKIMSIMDELYLGGPSREKLWRAIDEYKDDAVREACFRAVLFTGILFILAHIVVAYLCH